MVGEDRDSDPRQPGTVHHITPEFLVEFRPREGWTFFESFIAGSALAVFGVLTMSIMCFAIDFREWSEWQQQGQPIHTGDLAPPAPANCCEAAPRPPAPMTEADEQLDAKIAELHHWLEHLQASVDGHQAKLSGVPFPGRHAPSPDFPEGRRFDEPPMPPVEGNAAPASVMPLRPSREPRMSEHGMICDGCDQVSRVLQKQSDGTWKCSKCCDPPDA